MNCRGGEQEKTWFRSDRFYHVGQDWFFSTREKQEMGPFDSLEDAKSELALYIRYVKEGSIYLTIQSQYAGVGLSRH